MSDDDLPREELEERLEWYESRGWKSSASELRERLYPDDTPEEIELDLADLPPEASELEDPVLTEREEVEVLELLAELSTLRDKLPESHSKE